MGTTISLDDFRTGTLDVLGETFEQVQGQYLDRGTSLFETLASVDAATASKAASDRVATLAAQVDHIGYYIGILLAHMRAGGHDESVKADWNAAWQRTAVDEAEWLRLVNELRSQYEAFGEFVRTNETWDVDLIGGVASVLSHCAYHLGEIRQALGVIA